VAGAVHERDVPLEDHRVALAVGVGARGSVGVIRGEGLVPEAAALLVLAFVQLGVGVAELDGDVTLELVLKPYSLVVVCKVCFVFRRCSSAVSSEQCVSSAEW
jgi:hypothetical protein